MSEFSAMIVGCGAIAGGDRPAINRAARAPLTHGDAYAAHDAFTVVACVDTDPSRAKSYGAIWNVPYVYTDVDVALDAHKDIDIVTVCSPTSCHEDHAIKAIAAGARAIVLEKPAAHDAQAARRIADEADRANALVLVNFPRRFAPEIARLRDELEEGLWGQLRCMVGVYNKGLRHNGSHHIDLAAYLVDDLKIQTIGKSHIDFVSSDPTTDVVFETASGASFHLVGTHRADYAIFELVLYTERAAIALDRLGSRIRIERASESDEFPGFKVLGGCSEKETGLDQAFLVMLDELAGYLRSRQHVRSTIHTAVHGLQMIDAIQQGRYN